MFNRSVLLVSCTVALLARAGWAQEETAQPKVEPLFEMQGLFPKMGAPKIVVAKDGAVVAFSGAGRWVRRSEDRGKTFSPEQVVGLKAKGNVVVDDNSGDLCSRRTEKRNPYFPRGGRSLGKTPRKCRMSQKSTTSP